MRYGVFRSVHARSRIASINAPHVGHSCGHRFARLATSACSHQLSAAIVTFGCRAAPYGARKSCRSGRGHATISAYRALYLDLAATGPAHHFTSVMPRGGRPPRHAASMQGENVPPARSPAHERRCAGRSVRPVAPSVVMELRGPLLADELLEGPNWLGGRSGRRLSPRCRRSVSMPREAYLVGNLGHGRYHRGSFIGRRRSSDEAICDIPPRVPRPNPW
jgi:hypothetical protein